MPSRRSVCVCVWGGGVGGVVGVVGGEYALEYTGDIKDLIDRLPSKLHHQYENPISHLFPLFSPIKVAGRICKILN